MGDVTGTTPSRIGLAISGGGHRATIFALGALLYLADSGWNKKVHTIASVSGGSILNAFVALLRRADGSAVSFRELDGAEFEGHAAALASAIAGNPRTWKVAMALMLAALAASLFIFWLAPIDGAVVLGMLAGVLLVVAVVLGPASGGSLWSWWGVWIYCAVLVWLAAAGVASAARFDASGVGILTTVLVIGLVLQRRHWFAERAFDRFLRTLLEPATGTRRRLSLEDMSPDVRHVLCATELHSGQHMFFSHDFIYARGFGLGQPAALPVATAVQVSANFPGGFPIRTLPASRFVFSLTDRFEDITEHGFGMGRDILMRDEDIAWMNEHQQFMERDRPLPKRLMLTDGGVFDNLAVDWYFDNSVRLERFRMPLNWSYDPVTGSWPEEHGPRDESILERLRDDADCIVVINAGVTAHWGHGLGASVSLPLLGEVIGLSQISSTMYNNSTKERIRRLGQCVAVEMGFAERLVRTTLLPLGRSTTARLLHAGYSYASIAMERRFGKAATPSSPASAAQEVEPGEDIVRASAQLAARCERLARGAHN